MQFFTAALSKTGGRKINEDYYDYFQLSSTVCWAIADGLGGHEAGEIASMLAVKSIINKFKEEPGVSESLLKAYLLKAQQELIDYQALNPSCSSMRTTIALLVSDNNNLMWCHMGDTRIYYFAGGKIISQTKDHSVPQSLVNAGDIDKSQIRFHEDRNKLLRVLGNKEDFRPSYSSIKAPKEKDAILMCTDGFWEYVTEQQMEQEYTAALTVKDWLGRMEKHINKDESCSDDHDNYTAIAVWIR